MASLSSYRCGDVLRFDVGYIGIVSPSCGLEFEGVDDDKYIYLLIRYDSPRFCGEFAVGVYSDFRSDRFKHIGNIDNMLVHSH